MNYFDTLSFHLVAVFFMLGGCLLFITDQNKTTYKVLASVGSAITAITGGMLYARFGMSLTGPYPLWIIVKFLFWLASIVITVLAGLKFKEKARNFVWPLLFFMALSAALSVYKPL